LDEKYINISSAKGMVTFALSIICIRSTAIMGLSAWSGFIGRMGAQAIMGTIALAYMLRCGYIKKNIPF
jgi:hypothetical protein